MRGDSAFGPVPAALPALSYALGRPAGRWGLDGLIPGVDPTSGSCGWRGAHMTFMRTIRPVEAAGHRLEVEPSCP